MNYYFSNNTDYQQSVLIGSEKKMLNFFKKYHTGQPGNAYSYTITDDEGYRYIIRNGKLELIENY